MADFQKTRWSLIQAAAATDVSVAGKALDDLCRLYWYPIYAYTRRTGRDHHQAEDLTQGFFCYVLDRDVLLKASSQRGKLRTFLLTSLKHFLINEHHKARALKRGGGVPAFSIDGSQADEHYTELAVEEETPETVYTRQWAITLLEGVMKTLEAEMKTKGKEDLFAALSDRIAGGREGRSYEEIATSLGMKEGAVKVAIHRMRQRYRELLEQKIADTLESTDDVASEIDYLIRAISA